MLSLSELRKLRAHREYPSVSIMLPTHRTAPANKQDSIRAKNLSKQAIDRLHGEFSKREVAAVVKNLEGLVRTQDWEHMLDGLCLFAGREKADAFKLPFRVKPRVVIDETFATRDLVFTMNRAPSYLVLVLSEKPTRLYEAWTSVLEEHKVKPFPMIHKSRGGASRLPGGKGVNPSAVRDQSHREFFRTVDRAVAALQSVSRRPIILVGVERYLAFYQEVTTNMESVVGMLAGNHDMTSPSELGKLVWPVFQSGATIRRSKALTQLDHAAGAKQSASGIDQVWNAAFEKQVRTLLVEVDFEYPADVTPEGDRLLSYSGKGARSLDDAVDEVIERVLSDGGEVFFYPVGTLDLHRQIAAVKRK